MNHHNNKINLSKIKNSGFTLIELIIAVFILVIISGIIVSGISITMRSEKQISERSDFTAKLQMAMIIMTRDMRQFVYRPVINNDGTIMPALVRPYKNQIIEFTRTGFINPLGMSQRSELLRVAYLFQDNNLVRMTWRALDRAPNSKPSSRIILSSIKNIKLGYFKKKGRFINPATTSAPRATRVPLGVSFDFEFMDGRHIKRFFAISGAKNASS